MYQFWIKKALLVYVVVKKNQVKIKSLCLLTLLGLEDEGN